METNRLEDHQGLGDGTMAFAQPQTLQLGQTGCTAELDHEGVIHILNGNGQQMFALKAEHIPFEQQPLMVTLNLWFMAFNNGRASLQQELKEKVLDMLKSCL